MGIFRKKYSTRGSLSMIKNIKVCVTVEYIMHVKVYRMELKAFDDRVL